MLKEIWKIPKSYNPNKRKPSLLELFFDIIVVAMLGGVIHTLVSVFGNGLNLEFKDSDMFRMVYALLQLVTGLFVWRSYTLYSSRYERDSDIRHTTFVLVLMLSMVMVAASVYIELGGGEFDINLIYLGASGSAVSAMVLGWLAFSAGNHSKNKYEKDALHKNALGKLIFIIFILINIAIIGINNNASKWAFIVTWAVSLIVWIFIEYISMSNKNYANTNKIHRDHIQERYSILFIIFMGEMLIQIIKASTSEHEIRIDGMVSGVILMFSFFWWFKQTYYYPDLVSHPKMIFIYTFAMIGILFSIVFATVGIEIILEDTGMEREGQIVLTIAMGMWLFFESIVIWTLRSFKERDQFIIPKWWIVIKKMSFLSFFAIIFWTLFVSEIDAFIFIYYVTSYVWLTVLIRIGIKIWVMSNRKWKKKKFDKMLQKVMAEEKEWIKKSIEPYLDYEWHKLNDFDINNFSKIIKDQNINKSKNVSKDIKNRKNVKNKK